LAVLLLSRSIGYFLFDLWKEFKAADQKLDKFIDLWVNVRSAKSFEERRFVLFDEKK